MQGGGTLPSVPDLRTCPFCKHDFVDEPPSNKRILQENLEAQKTHENRLHIFKAHQENPSKNPPLLGRDNQPLTKAPKKPVAKEPILVCHCHQMYCCNKTDFGSTCPILCKKKDGSRYDYEKRSGCQCPICQCQCNMAWKVCSYF